MTLKVKYLFLECVIIISQRLEKVSINIEAFWGVACESEIQKFVIPYEKCSFYLERFRN